MTMSLIYADGMYLSVTAWNIRKLSSGVDNSIACPVSALKCLLSYLPPFQIYKSASGFLVGDGYVYLCHGYHISASMRVAWTVIHSAEVVPASPLHVAFRQRLGASHFITRGGSGFLPRSTIFFFCPNESTIFFFFQNKSTIFFFITNPSIVLLYDRTRMILWFCERRVRIRVCLWLLV